MIDNQPSFTAVKVALGFLILAGDEYGRSKCPPGAPQVQESLLRGVIPNHYSFILLLATNPIFAKLVRVLLSVVIYPRLLEGVGVRKCFMEEQVRTRIAAPFGCRQVVVLAAGYDTLALRLSKENSSVQFWEVDHPATSSMKQKALAAAMIEQPNNLHFLTADLTKNRSLNDALLSKHNGSTSTYDVTAPTVVIMEGLLMYLSKDQVHQLFADVASVVGAKGSSVCFDFLGWNETTNRLDMGWLEPVLRWWVGWIGEPLRWGIDPKQLPAFFADTPWRTLAHTQAVGWERLAAVERRDSSLSSS